MRIAAALLADYANVREGLMSALSLGVNRVLGHEFPSALRMSAVVVIEVGPAEGREFEVPISICVFRRGEQPPEVPQVQGMFHVSVEEGRTANLPLAVPLDGYLIEAPGEYLVEVTVADFEMIPIIVYVDEIESPAETS